MRKGEIYISIAITISAAVTECFAHSYGPAPRVTAAPGDNPKACTQCHQTGALNSFGGSVTIILPSGPMYIPGVKQRIQVRVADPAQQRWGFELSARLNSDPANSQAGTLTPIDNLTQVICEDAGPLPCASGVSFIQHTSAGTRNGTKGGATFTFDWTPPATDAGPITLYAAGNAANGDGTFNGDHIYTTSVQLDSAIPSAPTITGTVVSSATYAAGPVGPNSWVTVYGSNLSMTTRSWTDTDFVNGGMPFSLDGVSVILNVFGAPRLAYVGYVSPTQVNFLMPADATGSAYQVQVRNPAGISAQLPLTLQANAPQLFTVDGKHVDGTHADGTSLSSSPVSAGETVTLFGTGCGPTSPALIPGLLPAQPFNLANPPTITIGGSPATVVSGQVVPLAAGLYQISVQVPMNLAKGDQPVVAQVGVATSATTLLTVQ